MKIKQNTTNHLTAEVQHSNTTLAGSIESRAAILAFDFLLSITILSKYRPVFAQADGMMQDSENLKYGLGLIMIIATGAIPFCDKNGNGGAFDIDMF